MWDKCYGALWRYMALIIEKYKAIDFYKVRRVKRDKSVVRRTTWKVRFIFQSLYVVLHWLCRAEFQMINKMKEISQVWNHLKNVISILYYEKCECTHVCACDNISWSRLGLDIFIYIFITRNFSLSANAIWNIFCRSAKGTSNVRWYWWWCWKRICFSFTNKIFQVCLSHDVLLLYVYRILLLFHHTTRCTQLSVLPVLLKH